MVESNETNDRVLYNGNLIRIVQATNPDEHDVWVGENQEYHCYLDRGILDDYAQRDTSKDLARFIYDMHPVFNQGLKASHVSYDRLSWAFSKARMTYLNSMVRHFQNEASSAKERFDELKAEIDILSQK